MANKPPEFKGKPLIEIPETIPMANFLEGDFGKYVYNDITAKYGSDNPFVTTRVLYDDEDRIVKGSKPGYITAANGVFRANEINVRTATPADLEKILRINVLHLRGQYEDSALVLRSEDDPNEYLAKNLMAQIKARNPKAKMPVIIPLYGLELVKDSDSEHGLAFKLREDAEIIYAPILNKNPSHFTSEDIDKKTGLPTKLGKGDRHLYTSYHCVSRLVLGGEDLNLGSDWGDFAGSHGAGRVVVVSDEATSQKFIGEYLEKLREQGNNQIAEVKTRAEKAERYLRTGKLE